VQLDLHPAVYSAMVRAAFAEGMEIEEFATLAIHRGSMAALKEWEDKTRRTWSA
jgi:hypothetical protein